MNRLFEYLPAKEEGIEKPYDTERTKRKIFLSDAEFDRYRENPSELKKYLEENYKLSRTTVWRSMNRGWFFNEYLVRREHVDEEYAQEQVDLFMSKSRAAVFYVLRSLDIRPSDSKFHRYFDDLLQDTVLTCLEKAGDIKNANNPEKLAFAMAIRAAAGSFFGKERNKKKEIPFDFYTVYNNFESSLNGFDADHIEKLEALSEFFYSDEQREGLAENRMARFENVPIDLQKIMKVFVEDGVFGVEVIFNIEMTPKIEALLYECAARNDLLERTNFINNVITKIYDIFPNTKLIKSTTGSMYARIPLPNNNSEYVSVRVSDHYTGKDGKSFLFDFYTPTYSGWEDDLYLLYEVINNIDEPTVELIHDKIRSEKINKSKLRVAQEKAELYARYAIIHQFFEVLRSTEVESFSREQIKSLSNLGLRSKNNTTYLIDIAQFETRVKKAFEEGDEDFLKETKLKIV